MSFWVKPSESLLDQLTERVEARPHFAPQLEALHEMRQAQPDLIVPPGSNSWAHIASISVPLEHVARILEPNFFRDKRVLYRWLDKHPRWLTYDRRKHIAGDGLMWGWRPGEQSDAHEPGGALSSA